MREEEERVQTLWKKGGRWQMGFKRRNAHIPDVGLWLKEKEPVLQLRGEILSWEHGGGSKMACEDF